MADQKITELTADTAPSDDDLIVTVNDPGGTPVNKKVTIGNLLLGSVVQVVNTLSGGTATGSTTIPYDDTIPQNTEGTEFMTLAITPKSASNNLRIDVVFFASLDTANQAVSVALFRDSGADALGASTLWQPFAAPISGQSFTVVVSAGSTSATTFKVRAGPHASGTIRFNGYSGARVFAGVMASSITITEIRA